jgi:solute carrier family 35 protein E3
MLGTTYATALLASLGVLIAGVGMATVTEVQFSLQGCLCGCCAALFTAFHQILIKRAKDKHELGALQIMHRQAPPTALLLVFTSLSTDNVPNFLAYTPTFWAMATLGLTCLLAVLVIWTVVTLVTRTSPVTFQVIGLMKTCLTFVLGFLMFQNPITKLNIIGILIATVGFSMYTYFKLPSGHPPSLPEAANAPSESGVSEVISEESKDDE